jgi:5-amino-6-(5-phosphoribosylamino)uracil reductase
VQIVCSHSGRINPELRFFQQPVPRWLLTTAQGAALWPASEHFERIVRFPPTCQDWQQVLQQFYQMGIERLAVLGGGTLVASLVEQNVIDELHLTVCPLLLGGHNTPTPVDGAGLPITLAPQLELVQVKTVGHEVFLHYRCCHPKRD